MSESLPIALLAVLSIFFQFLTEWLFFVTKPSFFSSLSPLDRSLVLLSTPLIPSILALSVIFVFGLTRTLFKTPDKQSVWKIACTLIPTFFFATSLLLMLDNFTNVILHFGIGFSQGWAKTGYAIVFLLFGILIFRTVSSLEKEWQAKKKSVCTILTLILFLLFLSTTIKSRSSKGISLEDVSPTLKSMPNILLFGGDSIDALRMSAFGYKRDTTPFIHQFMKKALVCENSFANASQTAGSLTSILTSKLPTQTRVLHEPDHLKDKDSYQHLPGLLRKLNYRSAQFTLRIYGDAYDLNLKSSFDSVNFRSIHEQRVFEMLANVASQETVYFLRQTYRRITERLSHVFHLRDMMDPFSVVTQGRVSWFSDTENMNGLLSFIASSETPFFAHIHLLVTHGTSPSPQNRIFSAGRQPTNVDLYDDSIRDIDENFRKVIDFLERANKLNQTLIVFYSDHAREGNVGVKIPLIFWFPQGDYSGTRTNNVQLLDVAPTILDYMGLDVPEWMHGKSILSPNSDPCRKIVSGTAGPWMNKDHFWYVKSGPPFYSLAKLSVILCDRQISYDLNEKRLAVDTIQGYIGNCRCPKLSKLDVRKFIVEHLNRNGYDTSSIDAKNREPR